jgi:PPK2 family polyphosphate:nucleotide phosphotransferase
MKQPFKITGKVRIKDLKPDFHDGMDKTDARGKTEKYGKRIGDLQTLLYANADRAVVILFQGMDASGKDGAVRRVLEFVNPAGVETTNFKAPSSEERAHDYLWRVHGAVPRFGYLGVFNRSHYEDVLIVRVMNLQPEKVWKKRYDQINAFERFLAENNVLLLKYFLHISKEEQARRFEERLQDPQKNWKFSEDDLKVRAHWDAYQEAYEEMLNRCSTPEAPWHVVPADHKWYRDYVIARHVAETMEGLKMQWPKPIPDPSKIKVV